MPEHRPAVEIFLEPELFDREDSKQAEAPEQEVQVRAVPEPGRGPDDQQVKNHAPAAEREIQILAEPRAQRNVPPAPELRHAQREVRTAEVLRQVEAEHPADADGHERIAPEVKIELERVRERGHPRQRRREALKTDRGHIAPEAAELVGEQDLERHAEHEQLQPVHRLPQRHIARAELRLQLRIARDRAGDELREHGQVCAERKQRALRRDGAAVDIDEIAAGGKRKASTAQPSSGTAALPPDTQPSTPLTPVSRKLRYLNRNSHRKL